LIIFPFQLFLSLLSPFSFPSLRFVPWCSFIPHGICFPAPGVVGSFFRTKILCVFLEVWNFVLLGLRYLGIWFLFWLFVVRLT
jgi:hypothetical protein